MVHRVDLDDGRLITAGAVGFVGLGRMGGPMAPCLLRAGMPIVAYDIDPARTTEAREAGAEIASAPGDVAARSDVSLSMVMNDAVLREVALSDSGMVAAAAPGHLYCDLSTVSPQVSADMRRRPTGGASPTCAPRWPAASTSRRRGS